MENVEDYDTSDYVEEEFIPDAPSAWQRYDLHSNGDGTIDGEVSTNDNRDLGYPSEHATWDVHYRTHAEMMRRTGGSHTGCSGIQVTVYLNGEEVKPA